MSASKNSRWAFVPGKFALFTAFLLSLGAFALALQAGKSGLPVRGYTVTGVVAGVAALLAALAAGAYSLRKRRAQEWSRGPLSAWLAWHLVFSVTALVALWLHSGAHWSWRSGSVAAALMLLALGSGVFGLWRYLRVPAQVLAEVGNLAPGTLELEIRRLQQQRDLLLSAEAQPDTAAKVAALDAEIEARRARLAKQAGFRGKLRGWLWLHVPASLALVFVLVWHVAATWSTAFPVPEATSVAFEPVQDCQSCHPRQFAEWSRSMHAMAMQSPLTDIQNRLVVAHELDLLKDGTLSKPLVGDLCVRCHAPNAYLGDVSTHEPVDALLNDRARVTAQGVGCSTCHRISANHACASDAQREGRTFRRCEGGDGEEQERQFYNANNLSFGNGRVFYGPFEGSGEGASVGNSYHRGLRSAHMNASLDERSQLCASCHTVEVHDPSSGALLVRLQDTYGEWRESEKIRWQDQFACADCHNAAYPRSLEQARAWQRDRACLATRVNGIRAVMASEFEAMPLLDSAEPANGFDRPLQPRSRLNHAFTGVDIHLEPSLPAQHYPAFEGMSVDTKAAAESSAALLQLAAAVRIADVSADGLSVDVANLATGHDLPAGFAFARELWLEVSVSPSASGEDFQVILGGKDGRALANAERLDKKEPGLLNFQKVLYDSKGAREVVLQNQADTVLVGGDKAKALGFPDRQRFLTPGEIRRLTVALAPEELAGMQRVRVRLRFRSLPPEFLTSMAEIADGRQRSDDAARLREMVNHLQIVEVAQDERAVVATDADCP